MIVDLRHDGPGLSLAVTRHLSDRVSAVGGRLTVDPGHVEAELPCAS